MDIAGVTLANLTPSEPGSMASDVGMKMLDMSMEMQEAMSASMVRMMELSVNPSVGGNFDMSV